MKSYEVTIDFHDNAHKSVKYLSSESELSQYMERVPRMLGASANDKITIEVRTIPAPTLPTL